MSEIRNLTRNGETFYPLTHVEGVLDPDGEYIGYYTDNPEWIRVVADHEGKILAGIKVDGSIEWSLGTPQPIKDYIQENIIPALLNKVDKEEGKSLINSEVASSLDYKENPEYLSVELDANEKVLGGRKADGTKFENAGFDLGSAVLKGIDDPEGRMEVKIDSKQKIISYRKEDGTLVENAGIFTKGFKLSEEGMNGFKQDLINAGVVGDYSEVVTTLTSFWEGSHALNVLSVKKDGTGDFTTIQEAINSITDASVTKQYEVQVYDDFYINDLKELWKVHEPNVRWNTDTPNAFVSYIVTKDYVHLRGMGGMREVYVESPDIDMPAYCFQHIHPIFIIGNCKIENFIFKVKGGRYAIHQDLSGNRFSADSFKTSILRNIVAIHYGNNMYTNGSGWTSAFAQANGIANGSTQIFINVTWESYHSPGSFYAHLNDRYTLPCRLILINCRTINRSTFGSISAQEFGFSDRLSCQCNQFYLYNCDIPTIGGTYSMLPGSMGDGIFAPPTERETKKYCLNSVVGHGNKPTLIKICYLNVLTFITKDIGSKIEVIGGSAKDDVFGLEQFNYNGEGIVGTFYRR